MLACDLSRLGDESHHVLRSGADYLHLDVMDGHFVPNITWGPPVIASLRKALPSTFFDVHMMVSEPEKWVKDIAKAGGSMFTFHLEATRDPISLIRSIHEAGMKAGCAIKPGTPVSAVLQIAELVDMVLVMTVEPGFGGQSFMPDMMPKVRELRRKFPKLDIEVDGGLGPETIGEAARAGANMIVAGSSVFKHPEKSAEVILMMRNTVEEFGNGLPKDKLTRPKL